MAVVEIVRGRADRDNNSYEGRREATRIRLTLRESATISYVFSDWDSEIGLASNFGAMAGFARETHESRYFSCGSRLIRAGAS